jgi:multicomponent K+:H+ antiporter subunit E
MLKRLLPHPALSILVVVVWLLLLNAVSVGGLIVGLVIGFVVPLVTSRFWPEAPRLRWGPAMVSYLLIVIYDIVLGCFEVAAVILTRRNTELRSQWLVVPLDLRSPEAITALAATISLTPGTVSADVSSCGRMLLVHALDVADADQAVARIKSRYESRLLRIFA